MKIIIIDGESLTFEQVLTVAYSESSSVQVNLSDSAKKNVNRSAKAVEKLLERGKLHTELLPDSEHLKTR